MEFTTEQYLEAIKREMGKRATTYPKIIKKMIKNGEDEDVIFKTTLVHKHQNERLGRICFLIENPTAIIGEGFEQVCLFELQRELKMRKSYYPRLLYFKRIDEQTADYEIAVWESLTRWFAKEFLDLDELPTKRRKKKTTL